MIVLDHRAFQRRIHELLDDTRGRLTDLPALRRAVEEAMREHRIPLDRRAFSGHLAMLVAGNNRHRAHAYVEALGETGFTMFGQVLRGCFAVFNHTLFLMFCIVLLGKCGYACIGAL